jgi:hypothetical protein
MISEYYRNIPFRFLRRLCRRMLHAATPHFRAFSRGWFRHCYTRCNMKQAACISLFGETA